MVHDGFTADTRAWLQGVAASQADVQLVCHDHKQGCAAAVMTGLQLARGARIGLLNGDRLFQQPPSVRPGDTRPSRRRYGRGLCRPPRLRIELNGLQRTQPALPPSGPLNLGLVNPLVLPGQRNTLVLRRDPAGAGLADELLLTHLVIDDRVLGWAGAAVGV